jgi:PAS domain S-box-containing protein
MIAGSHLFFSLFNNLAIFIILVASYGVLNRFFEKSNLLVRQTAFGLIFGAFAIGCMFVKIPVYEGVIVDQRNTIVALSGAFSGPLAAILCAIMAGSYRIYLGGGGTFAGVVGVGLAAVAGICIYKLRDRIDNFLKAFFSALAATIIILPGFLFVGDIQTGWALLMRMALPYGAAVFVGIFFVGLLLAYEEHRHAAIKERKKAERIRLQRADRWQREAKVVTDIATSKNLANGAVTELVVELTQAVSGAIGVDRAGVWGFEDNGTRLVSIDNYDDSEQTHSSGAIIDGHEFREVFATLRRAKYLDVLDSLTDSGTTGCVEAYLKQNRIKAMLIAVIRFGNSDFGTLCFEHVNKPHHWEDDEIAFACQLADQLSLSISNRERKRAEEYRSQLISAIEQAGEIFVITDAKGTIQYVNSIFEMVTGYTSENAVGQNPRIFKSGKHDDEFYKKMWNTLLRGETWTGRLVNKKKDGTLYTEEAVISPVRDESGQTLNYVAIKRDITEALNLERQLLQAQKVEAIGRLAGGVAHDMNNLLTPILGYGELLVNDFDPGDRRRRSVEQILKAGYRSRDMVRQLLAFGRKQALEYHMMNLNKIIEEFEKLLRHTIRENITWKFIPSPGIPAIRADIGQIEQVIMNLVINAQDAMPDGGRLTIETTMVEIDDDYAATHQGVKPGKYAMLAVSDTGAGMDEETREHIFEPFFSTKGEKGTGLGLSTVYGIVKQHGGNIWVYSEPGKGTIFKVYLPISEEEPAEQRTGEESTGDLHGSETILLVEDNEQVREIGHSVLTQLGYAVLVAQRGSEALALMESQNSPVDLLITDVIMPGMNGKELFTKASEKQGGLKVLYMSGYTDDVIVHQGVLDKDAQFLQKPFTVKDLSAKVRYVIDN